NFRLLRQPYDKEPRQLRLETCPIRNLVQRMRLPLLRRPEFINERRNIPASPLSVHKRSHQPPRYLPKLPKTRQLLREWFPRHRLPCRNITKRQLKGLCIGHFRKHPIQRFHSTTSEQ